ncbi:type III secretion system cytoplasmic ring protein SctQ [Pseudomonas aeruginosa]|nr:type III secretion system cytoplasmic ring protein SctQ [Pseudomonas aeruginosa]
MKSGKPNERCGPRPAARQPRRTGSPATSRTLPSPLCRQRFASAPGHRPGRPRRRSRTEPGVGRPAPALSLPGPGAGPLARAEPAGGSLRQPAGGPATGLAGARRQRLSRPGLVRPEPGATTRCDGPAPEPGTRRPAPGALARRRSGDAAGTPAAAPSAQRLAIPLRLSLQWPGLPLDAGELRTLEPGDLLLLPAGHRPDAALLGVLEGRPWARCQLHSTQLELLDMHDTPSLADSEDLHELDQLPIPVSFEVGRRTLDLHTLSTLQPGSLLNLDCALDGEVRILANQRCLGIGELVRLQDRLGVRVTRLFGHDEA